MRRAALSHLFRLRPSFNALALGLTLAACGSPPPPAAPPAPASKPIAQEAPPPPPDLSAVPRPEALVVFARLAHPEASLKTVGGWTQLPMPGADVVSELVSGAPIGKVLDLSQPIDVAILMGGDARSPDPQVAVSAAVKSMDEVRGILGDKFKLSASANGAMRIDGLGGGDDHVCELTPAFGSAATRLVCSDSSAAAESLEPWLARSATRDAYPSDLHVELRMPPVRPIVKQFRGMLPMLLGRLLDTRTGVHAVSQAVDAAVGDLADLSNDLETLAVDVTLSDPGADATMTATFGGTSAVISRLALGHPEREGTPPPAFWHVPVDADVAYYTRGVEPRDIAHARELGEGVLLAALEKQSLPEADRKALVDPVLRYLDLHAGAIVYAKGLDMARIDKARAELDHAKDAQRKDAENALMAALGGWSVVQTTEPIAKVSQVAKDMSAALARPGLVKWAKSELHGAPAPSAKISTLPKTAGLPDGAFHMEVTVHDALETPAPAPTHPAPKAAGAAPPPAKAGPSKPRSIHVLLAPDAGKTWIVLAPELDVAIAKAKAVLPGAPDAGTLAKRSELDSLKDSKASSGGFSSARGLLAPSPFRYVIGGTKVPRGPLFEGLANTQAQGATPILFTTHAEAKGVAGAFVMTGKLPRGAVEDIVKLAMKRF
jgi:hypothetical protein